MKRTATGLAAIGGLMLLGATQASADTIFDVEHARAIARAGGPISEMDAELLNRWGPLSGTPGWRHRYRESFDDDAGNRDWRPRPRHRYDRD